MAGGKKPLFILPNLTGGGAERVTLQLLGKLAERGFDPTLLLIKREGALLKQVPSILRVEWAMEAGASVYLQTPRFLRMLRRLARRCDVIVGALEHEACYFAMLAGKLTRKPVVGWIHAVMKEHLGELSWLHSAMARQVYPRMNKLVFPSHASAASLAAVMPLARDRIAVIPSYVDCDELETLAHQPLPSWATEIFRKPTAISVGRLAPSKGLDLLMGAHARLRDSGIDHNLLVLGEGPLRPDLESVAARLGVRDSVFMPGFVDNPYPMMKAADVFVLASRFESMAMVLLEAMAVGCATIATDSPGGTREALYGASNSNCRDETCGLLVPPNDEAALANGIARLLSDGALRERLKTAAVVRGREFSSETLIPQWERLLTEVT